MVAIGGYRRDLRFAWDVVGVPKGQGARANFFGANGTAFTVPTNRNPAPGWTFLKYLGGPAGQRAYLAEFGAVPTRMIETAFQAAFGGQKAPRAAMEEIEVSLNQARRR